jgi:hypothetical protein
MQYLPVTVRLTMALRVGAVLKSTLQRYSPASALRTDSTVSTAGADCTEKYALGPNPAFSSLHRRPEELEGSDADTDRAS